MLEGKLKSIPPIELTQRWVKHPLPENLSVDYLLNSNGKRSIMGEILAAAYGLNPDPWLSGLDNVTATELTARVLGIPRLHVAFLNQVMFDHIINRKKRPGTVNEVAINTLTNPAMYLGKNAGLIMAFGRQVDAHTPSQWQTIYDQSPSSCWYFENERQHANQDYRYPDYNFGYHSGQEMAKLALIQAGVVNSTPFLVNIEYGGSYTVHGPSKTALRDVDEMLGLAVNEIQTFGSKRGRTRLYFLPKFFNDKGQPLTLDWLKAHSA